MNESGERQAVITKEEALRLAENYLSRDTYGGRTEGSVLVVDDEWTLERDHGWLFIYNTVDYVRTRNRHRSLVGAGPLLVLKMDGSLIEFSSACDREEALAAYEADPKKFTADAIRPA